MTRCIAFHSYKGGTGKTTLAANLAALLTKKGYSVVLLDLDVYAPSLHLYFETDPKKWINDFLFEKAELKEVVLDFTSLIESRSRISNSAEKAKHGKLWVGFCSAKKEEIYKLEGGSQATAQHTSKIHLLRRFILLRELLTSEYKADYIIIDTSPGIRYWSINALAVADTLLLTLKMGDLDIAGTRKVVAEIYDSFTKFGTKSFLLWNRIAGYCIPHNVLEDTTPYPLTSTSTRTNEIATNLDQPASEPRSSLLMENQQATERNMENLLTSETGMEVISAIPCYCDIQFTRKEFLTVLDQPEHPFAKQIEQLVHAVQTI
ncbi:MAG TPA: AAA family ATPase [Candidatus Bathyarchaeia archaeon]|nr:AAA family ATPase [Candidatus Bathyarchaeia archaeon]